MEPSVQGKGIGTRALQLALAESDAAGHPVLLKTNEERSLVICHIFLVRTAFLWLFSSGWVVAQFIGINSWANLAILSHLAYSWNGLEKFGWWFQRSRDCPMLPAAAAVHHRSWAGIFTGFCHGFIPHDFR